jgi:hypothetical protein
MTLVFTSAMTMASPWTLSLAGLVVLAEKASSKKLRLLFCLARSALGCDLLDLRTMSPGGGAVDVTHEVVSLNKMRTWLGPSVRRLAL